MIELIGDAELDAVLNHLIVPDANEIIVPRALVGHHEEAHEAVREH